MLPKSEINGQNHGENNNCNENETSHNKEQSAMSDQMWRKHQVQVPDLL